MSNHAPFSDALRSAYDGQLLDLAQRAHRAHRAQSALQAAGLWREDARLLDVGCGSGLLLANLGSAQQLRVGCDIRRAPYLQARAHTGTVRFAQASAAALPFPDASFDLVTCLAVIEEFEDWRGAIQEMTRCTAPGGTFYLTVTNGRLLVPFYRAQESLGHAVREDWWRYARHSLPILGETPEQGLGLAALHGWRYIPLTPHLAQAQLPWLGALPLSLLDRLIHRLGPSVGYAWQKPG